LFTGVGSFFIEDGVETAFTCLFRLDFDFYFIVFGGEKGVINGW